MKTSPKIKPAFDPKVFLVEAKGKSNLTCKAGDSIFVQGDSANALFYINHGKIKLTVISKGGREAVVAILSDGDFVGEGCLAGQAVRMATATALSECSITKVQKSIMLRTL